MTNAILAITTHRFPSMLLTDCRIATLTLDSVHLVYMSTSLYSGAEEGKLKQVLKCI